MTKEYFKLDADKILKESQNEEVLMDSSVMESIYVIRQLRALCALRDGVYRVADVLDGKINTAAKIVMVEDVWCPIILVDQDEECTDA